MSNFDLRFLGLPDIPNMLTAQLPMMPENMLTAIVGQQPPQDGGILSRILGANSFSNAKVRAAQPDQQFVVPDEYSPETLKYSAGSPNAVGSIPNPAIIEPRQERVPVPLANPMATKTIAGGGSAPTFEVIDPTTTGSTPPQAAPSAPATGIMSAFETPQGKLVTPPAVGQSDLNYFPAAPSAGRNPIFDQPFKMPQMPQAAPQQRQSKPSGPSGGEKALGFLLGLGTGDNAIQGLANAFIGARDGLPGNKTVAFLTRRGFNPDDAEVIARSPQLLNTIFTSMYKGQDPMQALEIQKAQLDILNAQKELNAPTKPNLINMGDGQLYNADNNDFITAPNSGRSKLDQDIASRVGAAEKLGLKPQDPAYQSYILTGKMPREDQAPLTATDKKAILEADEAVAAAENSIHALQSILTPDKSGKSLNDRASYGFGANAQSWAARNDPTGYIFDQEKGAATTELDNIVQTNALQSLKSIFGGNPTEGERAILLDIQGSSGKSPTERKAIFERAIGMAKRRLDFNRQRASDLRGGTFYKQGGSQGGQSGGGNTTKSGVQWRVN